MRSRFSNKYYRLFYTSEHEQEITLFIRYVDGHILASAKDDKGNNVVTIETNHWEMPTLCSNNLVYDIITKFEAANTREDLQ